MVLDLVERDAKRRALEDLYGGEVPDSMVDRLVLVERGPVVLSVN